MMTTVLGPPTTTFHFTDNEASKFRDYTEANQYNWRVRKTYYDMHTYQTVEFVKEQVPESSLWFLFESKVTVIIETGSHESNTLCGVVSE